MKRIKKGNKRAKSRNLPKGVVPLSAEEATAKLKALREKEEKDETNVVMLLDHLGRKLPHVNDSRRVTVLEDHMLKMPELWLNVFVFGPEAGPAFNKLFARAKCFKADAPDDADLVVFTGSGHDIDPQLYGQMKHESVSLDPALDKANLTLFNFCANRGIPMFGVCGGAQLLHVANGGALYQDVDGHNAAHTMWDAPGKQFIDRISSVHHQMCMPNEEGGMEIIGFSHNSRDRWTNNKEVEHGTHRDIEAFFYRDTCCLGVQGHPEYSGYNKYTVWCLEQIDHYLNENPDLSYTQNDSGCNHLRIKQEILDQRGSRIALPPPIQIEAKVI
jgi:gamma-glutamyl-gamma-aminobutyrate hydrolase PuuD